MKFKTLVIFYGTPLVLKPTQVSFSSLSYYKSKTDFNIFNINILIPSIKIKSHSLIYYKRSKFSTVNALNRPSRDRLTVL